VRDSEEEGVPEPGPVSRLLGSVSNLLTTLLTIGRTRLELLSVELQLEVRRVTTLLVLAFIALFATGVGLLVAGLAIILVFWDTHRVLAALLVTGFFIGIALVAMLVLAHRIRNKPRFLEHTLAELDADSRHVGGG